MGTIAIARTAAENVLLQKHEIQAYIAEEKLIRGLPIIDSNKPEHIDAIAGNCLRVLKNNASSFDFALNQIDRARRIARERSKNIGDFIKEVDRDYYKMYVSDIAVKEYFAFCGDHTIRQNLAAQILKDFQTGYVILKGQDKKTGKRWIEYRPPMRFMARRIYEDGRGYRELFLARAVFESNITGECFENGNEGYINIPAMLYPKLTATDKGDLQSYNPIYKLNFYGLQKNTKKVKTIIVPHETLTRNIAPEYVDGKTGYLTISGAKLHDTLIAQAKKGLVLMPDELLVSDFYIGKPGGNATLYYRIP